ncbi:unnamed protein product, partial [Durusdinium trenchii]
VITSESSYFGSRDLVWTQALVQNKVDLSGFKGSLDDGVELLEREVCLAQSHALSWCEVQSGSNLQRRWSRNRRWLDGESGDIFVLRIANETLFESQFLENDGLSLSSTAITVGETKLSHFSVEVFEEHQAQDFDLRVSQQNFQSGLLEIFRRFEEETGHSIEPADTFYNVNSCAGIDCSGNGVCEEVSITEAVCTCFNGFLGSLCNAVPAPTVDPPQAATSSATIPIVSTAAGIVILAAMGRMVWLKRTQRTSRVAKPRSVAPEEVFANQDAVKIIEDKPTLFTQGTQASIKAPESEERLSSKERKEQKRRKRERKELRRQRRKSSGKVAPRDAQPFTLGASPLGPRVSPSFVLPRSPSSPALLGAVESHALGSPFSPVRLGDIGKSPSSPGALQQRDSESRQMLAAIGKSRSSPLGWDGFGRSTFVRIAESQDNLEPKPPTSLKPPPMLSSMRSSRGASSSSDAIAAASAEEHVRPPPGAIKPPPMFAPDRDPVQAFQRERVLSFIAKNNELHHALAPAIPVLPKLVRAGDMSERLQRDQTPNASFMSPTAPFSPIPKSPQVLAPPRQPRLPDPYLHTSAAASKRPGGVTMANSIGPSSASESTPKGTLSEAAVERMFQSSRTGKDLGEPAFAFGRGGIDPNSEYAGMGQIHRLSLSSSTPVVVYSSMDARTGESSSAWNGGDLSVETPTRALTPSHSKSSLLAKRQAQLLRKSSSGEMEVVELMNLDQDDGGKEKIPGSGEEEPPKSTLEQSSESTDHHHVRAKSPPHRTKTKRHKSPTTPTDASKMQSPLQVKSPLSATSPFTPVFQEELDVKTSGKEDPGLRGKITEKEESRKVTSPKSISPFTPVFVEDEVEDLVSEPLPQGTAAASRQRSPKSATSPFTPTFPEDEEDEGQQPAPPSASKPKPPKGPPPGPPPPKRPLPPRPKPGFVPPPPSKPPPGSFLLTSSALQQPSDAGAKVSALPKDIAKD